MELQSSTMQIQESLLAGAKTMAWKLAESIRRQLRKNSNGPSEQEKISTKNIPTLNDDSEPHFYKCSRQLWDNNPEDRTSTYVRVWAFGYDEEGRRLCNVRYFMPYPTHIKEDQGVEVRNIFSPNIKSERITNETEIAKLCLLGL